MEKETIEEAAERLYPVILEDNWDKNKQYREAFVEGVQWQLQQQDEFAIGFADWIHSNTVYCGNGFYSYIGDSQQYKLNKLLEIYKQQLPK